MPDTVPCPAPGGAGVGLAALAALWHFVLSHGRSISECQAPGLTLPCSFCHLNPRRVVFDLLGFGLGLGLVGLVVVF